MSMKLIFEANTSKQLYREIAEFLGGLPELAPPPVPIRDLAKEAKDLLPQAPTPAILAALEKYGITEDEWPLVPRSGKGGRMTKADVEAYSTTRAPPAPAEYTGSGDDVTNSKPPATTDAPLVDDAPDTPTSLEDCREALKALNAEKGMNVCREVLSRFGVQRMSDLDEDRYADFAGKCAAVVNGAEV